MSFASDLAEQQAAITAISNQADSFLQSLLTATNVQFSNGFNIDNNLPDSYDYASVPQITNVVNGATIVPNISVVDNPPPVAPEITFGTVAAIETPQFLTTDLIAPVTDFTYIDPGYTSVLLDPLKSKLLYDLQNGGYGIDTTDEIALFNRARDREVEAMGSRIADAGRSLAMRGFPLPPGELNVSVDRAYQEMQDKVSDVSRDITLARAKLYVDNRQFTIREARELEQVLIGMYNAVQDRAVTVAKYAVDLAIAIYNVQLARFRMQLDAAKIATDVELGKVQIQVEQAKAYLDGFRSQITGYEAYVRTLIARGTLQVDYYRGTVDNARVINEALSARANLQAKVLESTTQQNIQISQMTIENAKAKLLAAVEATKLYSESIRFGASNFFAQLTALSSTINSLSVQTATA